MINQKKRLHRQQGFIALVSLLVIFTVTTLIALTLLKDGITNVSLSLESIDYENARINGVICSEDTFLSIKEEDQFSDSLHYVFDERNECSSSIVWSTPVPYAQGITETGATLQVVGQSGAFVRTFDYELMIRQHEVYYSDGTLEHLNNIHVLSITEINS